MNFYAERAGKSQQEEWAKVQGRFEDIAFSESTEQVLRLVGTALEKHSAVVHKGNLKTAIDLGLKPHQLDENEFIHLLQSLSTDASDGITPHRSTFQAIRTK